MQRDWKWLPLLPLLIGCGASSSLRSGCNEKRASGAAYPVPVDARPAAALSPVEKGMGTVDGGRMPEVDMLSFVGTGTDVLPFGQGMTPPKLLSGREPEYTPEALRARIEGTVIVQCVITLEGSVQQCSIIKPLPYMEAAVLDALYSRKYTPAQYQGRPVSVSYTFTLRLTLPR